VETPTFSRKTGKLVDLAGLRRNLIFTAGTKSKLARNEPCLRTSGRNAAVRGHPNLFKQVIALVEAHSLGATCSFAPIFGVVLHVPAETKVGVPNMHHR